MLPAEVDGEEVRQSVAKIQKEKLHAQKKVLLCLCVVIIINGQF